jgi:hypothetical protein
MKPEQQRIAIAVACGWLKVHGHSVAGIPDYPFDLNAMHEVEKVLTDDQWPIYRDEIRLVVLGPIRMVSDWCKSDIHATAAQRAEAFLRTIGKWEEAK